MSKRKHINVDTDNALTDIYQTIAADSNATAKSLCESIRLVKLGTEGEVRGLCGQFDVDKSERNAAGKSGKRSIVATSSRPTSRPKVGPKSIQSRSKVGTKSGQSRLE